MIKRLRKSIILMNMSFVGIVLLLVFSIICVNNYSTSRNDLERGLSQALAHSNMGNQPPPDIIGNKERKEKNSPVNSYVAVITDKNGNIISSYENNATIADNDLQGAVNIAFESSRRSGEISEYKLMYVKDDSFEGIKIAFADTSSMYASLRNTIIICVSLFAGSMVIIFLISLALSGLAVKPVNKAWMQQKQFVADASHELKTPLTVILANNNIMMSHKNATIEEERKWLESTDDEAKHMKKLIDQMLFLAKSDAEQTKAEITDVNISEITEGTVLNFEPVAYEKNIIINYNIQPGITVRGDKTALTQLTHILIDNAVKYTDVNGRVSVTLDKAGDSCRLSVNNSGNAIAKEDLPHLFDRFYRADKSRHDGGYGLGLSIASDIVKNHRGKISVESGESNGTTFCVIF